MDILPSPCIRNCCLNAEDICVGCFRSLAEITAWSQADQQVRLSILAAAENRRRQYAQKLPVTK